MVKLMDHGVFLSRTGAVSLTGNTAQGRTKTMTYGILSQHNHSGNMEQLELKFDALVSPDNNYVNILQTAQASGLERFPVPYVLSNCHNTLCAVGGTIAEDDHVFGLSSAKRYGGIFVPLQGSAPPIYAGDNGWRREDDFRFRLSHPIRCAGHHGNWGGRR